MWGDTGKNVYTHTYYNPVKGIKEKNEIYAYVNQLKDMATIDPQNPKNELEYKKYLMIRKNKKAENGYTIKIREDVIKKKLQTAGWLVLISNYTETAAEAIKIYRTKDVVEKGFYKLKNMLELNRLRVHGDERMQNKVFIGFIALILTSHIHRVMSDKNLYKKMSMDKLLITLSKIKVANI